MNSTKDEIKRSTATDGKPPVVGSGIDWDYVMIYVSMVAFAVIWVIAMLVQPLPTTFCGLAKAA